MSSRKSRELFRYFVVAMGIALVFSADAGLAGAQDDAAATDAEVAPESSDAPEEDVASEELATELDHRPPPSPEGVATPGDDTDDWMQINSGEWLRGEIQGMRDDVFTFDSEELDDQSFDWADIVSVHSPNVNRYVRNFDDVFAGPADLDMDQVRVQTDEGLVVFPRSELTAIIGGDDTEASKWTAFLGMGFDGNWGASEQITLSANAWVQREDARSRIRFSYDAAWGQSTDVVNVNNMWGSFRFDLYVSRLFYFTPLYGPTGYDQFLNIDLRTAPGSGAGIHIIDISNMDWDFDAGLAYVYTRLDPVPMDGDEINHDVGVRFGTFYSWDITGDIEFDARHETLLVATNLGLSQFTTRAMLSIDLTGDLDLDLSFRHTRIREAIAPADPTLPTPDNDQYQLTIGLGWDIG